MNKPPDNQSIQRTFPSLRWDKTKSLNLTQAGPIFLLMKRTNSNDSLTNVSPFLIKKAIDNTCNGEVEECKKLRNGDILIKTKNYVQANKLATLTALSDLITVEVTEFKNLNQSKGVIYTNDLRGIAESEITNELTSQNVCEVRKITKFLNNQYVETGLIILTFASSNLPCEIKIGYQKVSVRPYIPLPMKCNNCQLFGHIAKYCKNPKICFHCSKEYHLTSDIGVECMNKANCINCISNKKKDTNHSSKDKICPIFIKYKELQAIKTIEKVDNKTAYKIYSERHQHDGSLYSAVAKTSTTPLNTDTNTQNCAKQVPITPVFLAPTIEKRSTSTNSNEYDSLSDVESDLLFPLTSSKESKGRKIKILPRNTSKRLQNKLKSNAKDSKQTTKIRTKSINIGINGEEMDC